MKSENVLISKLGEFELRRQIGAGGMGAVYEAFQPSLDRLVAVKVLRLAIAGDEDHRKRFIREAMTSAKLEHPNIISIYDYGTHAHTSYIAMRLLRGGTISDRLRYQQMQKRPQPSLYEVSQFLTAVAGALDHAHNRDVIHRDVKPSNFMFDTKGNPLIVDFGIARLLQTTSSFTQIGKTLGTPAYMAPEQWNGEAVPASDQYALGGVIYTLLVGRAPFEATTPMGLFTMHTKEPLPPIHEVRNDIPQGISNVLSRAMAKLPEERYPSNREFAEEFAAICVNAETQSTGFFTFELVRENQAKPNEKGSQPVSPSSSKHTSAWSTSQEISLDAGSDSNSQIVPKQLKPMQWQQDKMRFLPYVLAALVVIGVLAFVLSRPNGSNSQSSFSSSQADYSAAPTLSSTSVTGLSTTSNPGQILIPILTATLPPTPTASWTPILTPYVVLLSDLEVHSGPGNKFPTIQDKLKTDLQVMVVGISPDEFWYQVLLPNGSEGWISASTKNVKFEGNPAVVSTIFIPTDTPTWTPTSTLTFTPTTTSTYTATSVPSSTLTNNDNTISISATSPSSTDSITGTAANAGAPLRTAPYPNAKLVRSTTLNESFVILGYTDLTPSIWYKVRLSNGNVAWIYETNIKITDTTKLPFLTAPPPPAPPTSTAAAQSAPTDIQPLTITADCSASGGFGKFVIHNPNPFEVATSWSTDDKQNSFFMAKIGDTPIGWGHHDGYTLPGLTVTMTITWISGSTYATSPCY